MTKKKPPLNRQQVAALMAILGMVGFVFLEGTGLKIASVVLFAVGTTMILGK